MKKIGRPYVGILAGDGSLRVIFLSATEPTYLSHGPLIACAIGPFRTVRGAHFMRDYGRNNPHCQTVDEAERLARKSA